MADYNKIPIPNPLRHIKDFYQFIADFKREWETIIRAISLIKSELKRLQDEKADS